MLEQEKLRRDVTLAADVQKRLLARQSLENDTVSIAAISIPARSVGGDYFDLLELDGGRTGIALADVAGKGVPAALIMSAVQATVRVLSGGTLHRVAGPGRPNERVSAQIHWAEQLCDVLLCPDGRAEPHAHLRQRGHNPPYLLRLRAGSLASTSCPPEERWSGFSLRLAMKR